MQELIRFAYSEKAQISYDNVIEIMVLADKYMIPSLTEECRKFLQANIHANNVFSLLPLVPDVSDKRCMELCWEIVTTDTKKALNSDAFLDIDEHLLYEVLEKDSLMVREVDIFQAVDRWAAVRIGEKGLRNTGENKRKIIGDELIKLIRFPLMSQLEFADIVLPKNILTINEVSELIRVFNKLPVQELMFSKAERNARQCLIVAGVEFGNSDDSTKVMSIDDLGVKSSLSFKTNKTVNLHAIKVIGHAGEKYDVIHWISLHMSKHIIYPKQAVSVQVDKDKLDDHFHGFTITLLEPYKIKSDEEYSLTVFLKKTTKRRMPFALGLNPKKVIHCEELKITLLEHNTESLLKVGPNSYRHSSIHSLIFKDDVEKRY